MVPELKFHKTAVRGKNKKKIKEMKVTALDLPLRSLKLSDTYILFFCK